MILRKIPLQALIEILQDLWDNGADFIDIAGENGKNNEVLQDVIKITIKPEYIIHTEGEEEDGEEHQVEIDYSNKLSIAPRKSLSDDDINELI